MRGPCPHLLAWTGVLALALTAAGVACSRELPPYAEALVVVDTDLPVPRVASRLRVDLFAEDGRWFDSRDLSRPDPRDWPASFGVYSDDPQREKLVWLRLRVYPDGRVRDYLGERFLDLGGELWEPAEGDGEPRLLRDGLDQTPSREPQPLCTVDRMVLIRLRPGSRGRVQVVLRGACVGTMVKLDYPPETCVDTERQRQTVTESALEPEMVTPAVSLQGTSGQAPCPEDAAPASERVCVPGGATLFGASPLQLSPGLSPAPERVVLLGRFWIDRYELTVGRFREALAAGFVPPHYPIVNEQEIEVVEDHPERACSLSSAPRGREEYALTCVPWETAAALCRFLGGDLPTEAQSEHAASGAGRPLRTRFPWGDENPTCERAVYDRDPLGMDPGPCVALGVGPRPVSESAATDLTPLGIVGLGGGVSEWQLDSPEDYHGKCWGESLLANPTCQHDGSAHSGRGGSWALGPLFLQSVTRLELDGSSGSSFVGVRCVYPSAR